MVAAVFHQLKPAAGSAPGAAPPSRAAAPAAAAALPAAVASAAPAIEAAHAPRDFRAFWVRVLPPLVGFGLLVLVWELVALRSTTGFPSPAKTWQQALVVFSDPFYRKGPNDQGVGWNVLASLQRVGLGFGLAPRSASRPASRSAASSSSRACSTR